MTRARDVATQGGLVLVTKAPFTSATTLNINNCFSSTYNNYKIIIESTAGTGGTGGPVYWASRNAGSTDRTTVYSWLVVERTNTFASFDFQNQTSGFAGRGAISTAWGQHTFEVIQPFLNEYTNVFGQAAGVSGGVDSYTTFSTLRRVASSHDGITFDFPDSTTGTVYVYGYKV